MIRHTTAPKGYFDLDKQAICDQEGILLRLRDLLSRINKTHRNGLDADG